MDVSNFPHCIGNGQRQLMLNLSATNKYEIHHWLLSFKVEKILKGTQDSISSPSPSVKIQIWEGKFAWGIKAKHCWALSTNFWIQKLYWQCTAMFCLYASSKLEFSLKVKVMRSNPGYLLKSSLLYQPRFHKIFEHCFSSLCNKNVKLSMKKLSKCNVEK